MKELWLKCDINYVTEDYNIFLWLSVLSNGQKWNIILMGNKSFSCHQTNIHEEGKRWPKHELVNIDIKSPGHTNQIVLSDTNNKYHSNSCFDLVKLFCYWKLLLRDIVSSHDNTNKTFVTQVVISFIHLLCVCVRKIKFCFCLVMLSIGLVKNRSQLFYARQR